MAQIIPFAKVSPTLLTTVTPEGSDFLQRIRLGEWINAEVKRVRNYKFHKKFFKLLQLGFEYWNPTGGAILPEERHLVNGFVDYLCRQVGQQHSVALADAADQYLEEAAYTRSGDLALLKSFDAYREWVTIQAGYYTEHLYPDGSRNRRAKSISFANMDDIEFHQLYKSAMNVLWNFILFRSFKSQEEVENVAAQLLEYAA
ncbi:DUF1367 family protein [Serratia sp. JSRIV004]|uniref:DUF1367 family protein n=1 Tax=Serratia sp. JSRIV004 TaxID=2831895 RepID=UPI001CC11DDE|nr:DUF1367 family protein [Serratia sp. JSRIV004]UAN55367.1 DUF1367 family protein [Serratia sp. JSRIV004]